MSRRTDAPEGALARWSRRKRGLQTDPPVPAPDAAAEPGPAAEAEPEAALEPQASAEAEARADAEILAKHGLPDPDTLAPGDDIKGFMAKGIPARLRNRALRKLWTSNPVLANLDELVDYGDDFTDAATVIENLATGWQVGRGYLIEEPEPEPEPDPEADAELSAEVDAAPEAGEPQADPAALAEAMPAPEPAPPAPAAQPVPRHMRFRRPDA